MAMVTVHRRKKSKDEVVVQCYGKCKIWPNKESALEFYKDCARVQKVQNRNAISKSFSVWKMV